MSPCKSFILVLSLAPAMLVGCANIEPVEVVPDPRIDQLLAATDSCLANQTVAITQLQDQSQQLASQTLQLGALEQQLATAQETAKTQKRPPPPPCPKPEVGSNKQVVGIYEQVWLPDLGLSLTARMDTGRDSASLDASNIKQFERDGKPWVRFELVDPATGEIRKYERKLKRTVAITRSGEEVAERPVVKMGIVIGRIDHTADFTLYNHTHKDYQLNIGRDILKDVMVVDVSKKNVTEYELPEAEANADGASR